MPVHAMFDDEILGRVTWNAEGNCWEFDAGPVDGRSVPAGYIPGDSRQPPAEQGWDEVRACVLWVRANQPAVRAYIMEKVHNPTALPSWWLRLSGINFYKDREARLIYADFGLLAISVRINALGQIVGSDVYVSG